MAGSSETLTPSDYITHHLQNLTFGRHPDGSWGIAHGAEEAASMGFWAIHLDSMFWSIALAVLFGWFFMKAAKSATAGVPAGLQNFVEIFTDEQANAEFSEYIADRIRQRVKDPAVAEKLIPKDHGFGVQRDPPSYARARRW